jgi:hypothetical protein
VTSEWSMHVLITSINITSKLVHLFVLDSHIFNIPAFSLPANSFRCFPSYFQALCLSCLRYKTICIVLLWKKKYPNTKDTTKVQQRPDKKRKKIECQSLSPALLKLVIRSFIKVNAPVNTTAMEQDPESITPY